MKEHPILFSGAMVRAILEGRKTQTRRVVKPQFGDDVAWAGFENAGYLPVGDDEKPLIKPKYIVGDRLWVRETWTPRRKSSAATISEAEFACFPDGSQKYKKGDYYQDDLPDDRPKAWPNDLRWRPSIHMPRWACRITLEITGVRVERVRDIGKDGRKAHDVLAEGITRQQIEAQEKFFHPDDCPALAFGSLWESINGKRKGCTWKDNPWVWIVEFKRIGGAP